MVLRHLLPPWRCNGARRGNLRLSRYVFCPAVLTAMMAMTSTKATITKSFVS
jgi:hypothetical protein